LPPPATNPEVTPAELPEPAGTRGVADPGWTQFGLLPTARTLREGDLYAHYIGYMGLFGVQYGINGDADIGAGIGLFTIQLAAKYAFYHDDNVSVAAFAELSFPFYKGYWPMTEMGDGLEYLMLMEFGPLFSLWNDTAELDIGLMMIPVMQWPVSGSFDTDFLVLPYVVGSIGLGGMAKFMFGFEHVALTALERGSDLNLPALMIGVRIHGERFLCDIGLHFPMSPLWWDNGPEGMIFIPSISFGHLW